MFYCVFRNCYLPAQYGYVKPVYCEKHKAKDMLEFYNPALEEIFNVPELDEWVKNYEEREREILNRRLLRLCNFCDNIANYCLDSNIPIFCHEHISPSLPLFPNGMCKFAGCKDEPIFGYNGYMVPLFCKKHKIERISPY